MPLNPSQDVLAAFGISSPPVSLSGGQAQCFLAGEAVLKPCEDSNEAQWTAELVSRVHSHLSSKSSDSSRIYRVPRPLSLVNNPQDFVYSGWTAWSRLPGREETKDYFPDTLTVCRAFHRDLAQMAPARPSFLNHRGNRWTEADRVTWGEKVISDVAKVSNELLAYFEEPLRRLDELRKPLPGNIPVQLIHGDMTGNILFEHIPRNVTKDEDGSPEHGVPGIIDMTPYWRPATYAEAIIIADALLWHGEGIPLLKLYCATGDETMPSDIDTKTVRLQLLIRALYWRGLTFAIDPDMDWMANNLPKSDFPGAVRLLQGFIQDR